MSTAGYKLLAVDVDGTLLRRDGSIHSDDRAAIERLGASGIPVTIVTGRLYSGTRHVAQSLQLTGPIACVDGSHIVDLCDSRALYYSAITGALATTLRDVIVRARIASFLFANDAIAHDASGHPFAGYVRTWSPNIDVVDKIVDHPFWENELGVMAVVSVGAESQIRDAVLELASQTDTQLRVISFRIGQSAKHAMIVRASAATKGTAVEWLAQHHGCTSAEVVVVGDWLNDLPMFEVAGRSFAMGQAPEEVKGMATDTLDADGITGGGIAEAIRCAWGL